MESTQPLGTVGCRIRNGNTWYSSIVNHMMTNKHTDGIVGYVSPSYDGYIDIHSLWKYESHDDKQVGLLKAT